MDPQVFALAQWARRHAPVAVLTGAGVSTASGIPDYRDADGQWKRSAPIKHQAFMGSAAVRQRYWARSMAGWPVFTAAQPNAAHRALAALQRQRVVGPIITQNVDRLHQRAGSSQVLDLHGRLDRVICMRCGAYQDRDTMQAWLEERNPGWRTWTEQVAPDGDADIDDADFAAFRVPPCPRCGGVLKPDVVFYGGMLAPAVRQDAEQRVVRAGALLIVGSSIMIGSAHRLVRVALAQQRPVAAINRGHTRVDGLLALKLDGDCAPLLQALAGQLQPATSTQP
ncbi:MAG: NAD-dependent protein deacetylase [Ottowia sp.]|nr:NAD-dependent protein deacetylase [Ottowia sp.]